MFQFLASSPLTAWPHFLPSGTTRCSWILTVTSFYSPVVFKDGWSEFLLLSNNWPLVMINSSTISFGNTTVVTYLSWVLDPVDCALGFRTPDFLPLSRATPLQCAQSWAFSFCFLMLVTVVCYPRLLLPSSLADLSPVPAPTHKLQFPTLHL